MRKLMLALCLLTGLVATAQKVDESQLEIPYRHQALFSFATGEGGMMQVYFEPDAGNTSKQKGVSLSVMTEAEVLRSFIHIGMFTSFDLEKYGPRYSNQGKQNLRVVIRVTGEPVMKIEDGQGFIQQGYSSKQHFFKKGTYIVPMVADIKNDKGELLKTIVISNEKTPHYTYFFDASLAKNADQFFKQYYSMNTSYKEIDSFYRMVNPGAWVGYGSKDQLDRAYNNETKNTFTNLVRANAFNEAMLNLNYMLKAGLENVDKTDEFKVYTIGPKKEKEADKYKDEMAAGELLNKVLTKLQANGFVLSDENRADLLKAKSMYDELIRKSDKNVGQGLKSMFGGGGSAYYNALFNNGALVEMLLGNYTEMKQKIDRYEPAEKMSDAFNFKKMSSGINYKLDFINKAEYRAKIEKGSRLMQELNP